MENKVWLSFYKHRARHVDVAAASVVELPPRCSNKGVNNVDVYKTYARIIFVRERGAAQAWPPLTNPLRRQNTYSQRPVR